MKKIVSFVILFCLPMMGLAKIYSDPSKPILLTKDKTSFTIELASNRTTGYSWYILDYPKDYLKLTKHHYFRSKDAKLGEGGKEQWIFDADQTAFAAPMMFTIQLAYFRPWELKENPQFSEFVLLTGSRVCSSLA